MWIRGCKTKIDLGSVGVNSLERCLATQVPAAQQPEMQTALTRTRVFFRNRYKKLHV